MRILLLGRNGQLGWELNRTLPSLGELRTVDRSEVDLTDLDTLRAFVRGASPDVILNAAAYTDVDRAESERGKAFAINAIGPDILAQEAKASGAVLIHFSTDYVFDGRKGLPYNEIDRPNPINFYGKSKLAGEHAIQATGCNYLLLRTAWVYTTRRDSFVRKVWTWARKNETLKVVDDQVSNPTWARMLAEVTAQVISRGLDYMRTRKGLYHLAGNGVASRFEWAHSILSLDPYKKEQIVKELLPAKTNEFPSPAERPLYSGLDCSRFINIFGLELPNWRESLKLACNH